MIEKQQNRTMSPLQSGEEYFNLSSRQVSTTASSEASKGPNIGLILGIVGMIIVMLILSFMSQYLPTVRYMRWRARRHARREQSQWFGRRGSDVSTDFDDEYLRAASDRRRASIRPWIGLNVSSIFGGSVPRATLTGDRDERRGCTRRCRRHRGRLGLRTMGNDTQTTLPLYTERDEGVMRVPGYEGSSRVRASEDDRFETVALHDRGRRGGGSGEVGIELQVLERVVVR